MLTPKRLAAALEPKETAAAIVAIVIDERRTRSAQPVIRKNNDLVIVTL